MIRKSYISQLYVINKKNIEDFELLHNHRYLRPAQIGRIYAGLKQGKHFESPIVINQLGKKMRILDGGHRVKAMEKFIGQFPDNEIEVNMAVYRELNNEEELEVFEIWNKGIKQSPDDFLNLRKDEMEIFKLLQKNNYPCKVSIYSPSEDGIKFKILVGAYLGSLTQNNPPNSYDADISLFIDKAKELGHKDWKFLNRFMEGFISAFGYPNNKNPFSSYVIFNSIMRVYFDNFFTQGDTYLWNKMKSTVYKSSRIREDSLSGHARLRIGPCIEEMLRLLNKGKRSNLFVLRTKNTD